MVERRQIIKRLPAIHQTETLQRFFSATVDHLFQPHQSEQLSGYIGRRPLYVNPEEDFYLPESSDVRTAYSLEPLAISTGSDGSIRNALYYDDLINNLRFQGGRTADHNRLFQTEYYSWAPPVDLDMLLNPGCYYWIPEGPDPVVLESPTDVALDLIGNHAIPLVYRGLYRLPTDKPSAAPRDGAVEPLTLSSGMRLRITNDAEAHRDGKVFVIDGIGRGAVLTEEVVHDTNLGWDYIGFQDTATVMFVESLPGQPAGSAIDAVVTAAEGKKNFAVTGWYKLLGDTDPTRHVPGGGTASRRATPAIPLTNGMELLIAEVPALGETALARSVRAFRVSGVTRGIELTPVAVGWDSNGWDLADTSTALLTPDYIVMERGAADRNDWSLGNRWFHRDLIGTNKKGRIRAKRPILQFRRDLELFNHGLNPLGTVDVVEPVLAFSQINGRPATDPDFLQPYDHLRDFGVAPLLLDADPASKQTISVYDATASVTPERPNVAQGESFDAVVATLTDHQLARSLVYTSLPDGSYGPLRQGTDYTLAGQTLRVAAAATSRPTIKVIYWDSARGILIRDGMTILLSGDPNPAYNNEVYRVSGIKATGRVILTRVTNGSGSGGSAGIGDSLRVRYGTRGANSGVAFDGLTWVTSQAKIGINQEPLFQLYDIDGVRLQDEGRYPGSDFTGSPLFSYAVSDSTSVPVDTVLFKRIKRRDVGLRAEIVFENHLDRSLAANRAAYDGGDITGYYFHRTRGRDDLRTTDWFDNDWHRAAEPTTQYVTHTFYAQQGQTEAETAYRVTIRQNKAAARVVATAPLPLPLVEPVPLTGPLVIDGVELADGDRILAVGQSDPVENGLYEVEINPDLGVYVYFRALDANSDDSLNEGTFVAVGEGETGRYTAWVQTSPDPVLPGTTATIWRQIDGPKPFPRPIIVFVNNDEAVLGQDYEVIDGVIRFAEPLAKNTVVRVRVYANRSPDRPIGAYEIPANLQANPDWQEIGEVTQADFRDHVRGIIAGQRDFTGNEVAANNYRDTEQNLSVGSIIVQHRSPLLKAMLLSSNRDIDFILACQHAEREYARFRNKLTRKLLEHFEDRNSRPMEVGELLDNVLDDLALGRTEEFAFAYSDMVPGGRAALVYDRTFAAVTGTAAYGLPAASGLTAAEIASALVYLNRFDAGSGRLSGETLLVRGLDYRMADDEIVLLKPFGLTGQDRISVRVYRGYATFVPPSPAHLGLRPIQEPVLAVDTTLLNPRTFVIGHDGSYTDAFTNEFAVLNGALLEFERRVYNSTAALLTDPEAVPAFDHRPFVAAKFRRAADFDALPASRRSPRRADYEHAEWIEIQRPMFERWATLSGIDHRRNLTYAADNPWTWNYRGIPDRDGEAMPGHWRAIFKFYFDTDRPHSHPWEMLGFSQRPSWWETHYGTAPYNRSNTILWEDLEAGIVRDGPNRGVRPQFARPGLSGFVPVDETGRLLDPVSAGIVSRRPMPTEASRPWVFGDHGPAETTWTRHPLHGYAVVQAQYLIKPAAMLETTWDTTRIREVYADDARSRQWVFGDTRDRPRHQALWVHGETLEDGSVRRGTGSQQIIADFIKSAGQGVTDTLGLSLRGLGVRLGHKLAGFVDGNTLQVRADNVGVLPAENVNLQLYRSPSVAEYAYSGVIVEWTGRRWRVVGYDIVNPAFRTIPHDLSGEKAQITVGGSPAVPASPWRSNVYYTVNVVVTHQGEVFRATRSHQSGAAFDIAEWAVHTPDDQPPGLQVVYHKTPNRAGRVVDVPYGTEFATQQDLFDFLISYGRWLTSQGWVFTDTVAETGETRDWLSVGKDYLFWTLGRWQPGTSIALSPAAKLATFRRDHGEVQSVEQIVQGVYSILNRDGTMISPKATTVSRMGGEVTITPRNTQQQIFAVRLFVSEIEHVLIFDNVTIFGDLIYSPLFNLRQPRLKLHVARSADWKGRIDAPGFIVSDNVISPEMGMTLFANLEKTADDFRRYYSIEDAVEAPALRNHARHLVGYQPREYMTALLLDPTVQFEFYQGMIHSKGTINGMQSLLRNLFVTEAEEITFHDEWMFRIGSYGGLTNALCLEFVLAAGDLKESPQLVEFRASPLGIDDSPSDTVINLSLAGERDPRWVLPPSDALPTPFPVRRLDQHLDGVQAYQPAVVYEAGDYVKFNDLYFQRSRRPAVAGETAQSFDHQVGLGLWVARKDQPGWLPTAGYWRFDEIDHFARDHADLAASVENLIASDLPLPVEGSLTAVYDTGAGDWTVYRTSRLKDGPVRVIDTVGYDGNVEWTLVRTDLPHGRTAGDWVLITGDTRSRPDLTGVHEVLPLPADALDPTGRTLMVAWNTTLDYNWIEDAADDEVAPEILVFHPVRLAHHSDLTDAALAPPDTAGTWAVGDVAFCDSGRNAAGTATPGRWSVHRFTAPGTTVHVRSEAPVADAALIGEALIYDRVADAITTRLIHHDPIQGVLPGIAEREIFYKLEFDPAKYSHGDAVTADLDPDQAWGPTELGRLWWDLSTVRFLDYTICNFGGTDDEVLDYSYRRAAWGSVAPRASVDCYEWVRSPVPPARWADYVEEAAGEPEDGFDYKPTGEARVGDAAGWVERVEYNPQVESYTTFYYFWVRNTTTLPRQEFRSLPARDVARMIADPRAAGLAFFAPVGPDAAIIANVDAALDDDSVVQIRYRREERDDNVHRQWVLMREGDAPTPPDEGLWAKMCDSLAGYDILGQAVPDPALSAAQRCGTEVRPRQTWFTPDPDGRASRMARRIFIETLNDLLASQPIYEREDADSVLSLTDAAVQSTLKPPAANLIVPVAGISPRVIRATLASAAGQTDVDASTVEIDGSWIRLAGPVTDTILLLDQNILPNGLYTAVRASAGGPVADTVAFTPAAALNSGDIIEIVEGGSRRGSRWIWSAAAQNAFEVIAPTEYHREVETLADRDALVGDLDLPVEPGEQILVHRHPTAALQWWSIWQYRGNATWVLTAFQQFHLADFWEPLDWFAEGYSAAQRPLHVFASELDRDTHARVTGFAVGDLVEIRSATGSFKRQVALGERRFRLVGRSGGTIRLSDRFWQADLGLIAPATFREDISLSPPGTRTAVESVLDPSLLDRVESRDGTQELMALLGGLSRLLSNTERNRLFFAMVRLVHSQQATVDWAAKSSLMVVRGINEPLEQRPVLMPDRIGPLFEFINEVKPFHTKIRDFTLSLTTSDAFNVRVTDFDKPPYPLDRTLPNAIIPVRMTEDGTPVIGTPYTAETFKGSRYHQDWWAEFLDSDGSPVRSPQITLHFDRIKWIDWTVEGNTNFLNLYNRTYGTKRAWGVERALVPGHRVMWKNFDGLSISHWRVYQMIRPNPQPTLVTEVRAVSDGLLVRTDRPHLLAPAGYTAGKEVHHLTLGLSVPLWSTPATGRKRSYTLPVPVRPTDLRVAVAGQWLIRGTDYTLETGSDAAGYSKIVFKVKPVHGVIEIHTPSKANLRGTHKILRWVSDREVVIQANAGPVILPQSFTVPNVGIEVYGWRTDRFTVDGGEPVYLDHTLDPALLTQAERVALYYRPGDGMPANNNREILGADLKIPLFDGDGLADADPAVNGTLSLVYDAGRTPEFVLPPIYPADREPDPETIRVSLNGEPLDSPAGEVAWDAVREAWVLTLDAGITATFAHGDLITAEILPDPTNPAFNDTLRLAERDIDLTGSSFAVPAPTGSSAMLVDGSMRQQGPVETFTASANQTTYWLSHAPVLGVVEGIHHVTGQPVEAADPTASTVRNAEFDWLVRVSVAGLRLNPEPRVSDGDASAYDLSYDKASKRWALVLAQAPALGAQVRVEFIGRAAFHNPYLDQDRPQELIPLATRDSVTLNVLQAPYQGAPKIYTLRSIVDRPQTRFPLHRNRVSEDSLVLVSVSDAAGVNTRLLPAGAVAVEVETNEVVLSSQPTGTVVEITVIEPAEHTVLSLTGTVVAATNAQGRFEVTLPVDGYTDAGAASLNRHAGLLVWHKPAGQPTFSRLQPVRTAYWRADGFTTSYVADHLVNAPANSYLLVQTGLDAAPTKLVSPTHYTVANDAATGTATVTLVTPPAEGLLLTFVSRETGDFDYEVSATGKLLVSATTRAGQTVTAGDQIRILSFGPDDLPGIRTEVFTGTADHRYVLSQKPWDRDALWVDLNGRRLVHGIDYTLDRTDIGWDRMPWDVEGWDLVDRFPVLVLHRRPAAGDRLVVTTLARPQSEPVVGFSIHHDGILAETDYRRRSDYHTTRLTEDLRRLDTQVVVANAAHFLTLGSVSRASGMVIGEPLAGTQSFRLVIRSKDPDLTLTVTATPSGDGVTATGLAAAINDVIAANTAALGRDSLIRAEVGDAGDLRIVGPRDTVFSLEDTAGTAIRTHFGQSPVVSRSHLDEPGVAVLPNGERIEYREIDLSTPNRHRLLGIKRAAQGTSNGIPNVYENAAVTGTPDGDRVAFTATFSTAVPARRVMVHSVGGDGLVREYHRTEFALAMTGRTAAITLTEAPEAGQTLRVSATVSNWLDTVNPIQFPTGTCLVDAGPIQRIPGGFKWETEVFPPLPYDGTTLSYPLHGVPGRSTVLVMDHDDGSRHILQDGTHYRFEHDAALAADRLILTVHAVRHQSLLGTPVVGVPQAGKTWTIRGITLDYHGLQTSRTELARFLLSSPGGLGCQDLPPPPPPPPPPNEPPIWVTPVGTIAIANSGSTINTTLLAVDPEGLAISYSVVSGSLPAGVVLQGSTGIVSGTVPVVSTLTTTAFTVRASDGLLFTDRLFSITVRNRGPVWVTPAGSVATVAAGGPISTTLLATDPDGQPVSYSVIAGSLPEGSVLQGGVISGTAPRVTADTTATFTVRATDGDLFADREFSITVVTPCTAAFDVDTVGTLTAGQLVHAAANEAGPVVPPEWLAYPEHHAIDRVNRKIFIPVQEYTTASNGQTYEWRFIMVDLDTGERTYIDPFDLDGA